MTERDLLTRIQRENDELRRRLDALEGKSPSPSTGVKFERINPLDRLAMPASAMEDLIRAVPSDVMRDVVSDQRRSIPQSTSLAEPPRGSGWVDPLLLRSPPGIDVIDALCDRQDEHDKRRR
jgi:hypothetical protein